MTDKNVSFQISPPPRFLGIDYYSEEGKKYFLFSAFSKGEWIFNFWNKCLFAPLMVSDNDLVNQFKTAKKDDIFTTPLTNLQFKPDFLTWDDETLNGLVIKDASQVQKSAKISYPEFAFKVIKRSEFKEMEGYKPENKFLELEIEPLDIGIEGLPKITKIQFYFFTQNPPHISPVDRQLNKEKYEKLFQNAESKEFTIKTKKLIFGDRQITKLGQNLAYDTLSFSLEGDIEEIKEKTSKNSQGTNGSKSESNDNENNQNTGEQKPKTPKTILIIGGIFLVVLSLIGLIYYWKKKNEKRK